MPAPTLADLSPMLLTEQRTPFSDPEWLFEIKFDGYRMLAETGGRARLKTRGGADATLWFPEVAVALNKLPCGRCIVDGEVAVIDGLGRSDFNRLQDRARRRRFVQGSDHVAFIVFDLLVHKGESIMGWPLLDRKAVLRDLLTPKIDGLLFLDHIEEDGEVLYRHALQLELEGIVAKRKDSPYVPGARSRDWRKIKRPGAVPAERFKR